MRRLIIVLIVLGAMVLPGRVRAQNDIVKTFAGGGPNSLPAVPVNPSPAQTAANLDQPTSVAADGSGTSISRRRRSTAFSRWMRPGR